MADIQKKDPVEEAKERLLDPFEPIFPMPGMWHAITCFLFTLLGFGGFFISLIDHFELHPGAEFFLSVGSALLPVFFLIMISRGHAWAATGMQFLMYAPFAAIIADLIFKSSVQLPTLIFSAFAVLALLLSVSKKYKGFVNIQVIRHAKLKQMKRDGTFEHEREKARRRWGMK
jgi:hypothetical protein